MEEQRKRGRPPKSDSVISEKLLQAPEVVSSVPTNVTLDKTAFSLEKDSQGVWHLVRAKYSPQLNSVCDIQKTRIGTDKYEAEFQFKSTVARELFGLE